MFRKNFKHYKKRKPSPDFSSVLDFSRITDNTNNTIIRLPIKDSVPNIFLGLIPSLEWQAFQIETVPGLIFIKNPFTSIGQRYWISRCLSKYTKKPQKLNIDLQNNNDCEDWWTYCCKQSDTSKNSMLRKLRWATLGYHHNWDTKIYSESSKDVFPTDLASLSKYIANAIGLDDFNPEAAIVNFYHMDSTLSGHTDHSEDNLDAPLISCSFGQSAIFLIGGLTEDCPATPIFIHSGDIIIMSKESRLCYHAVPRITRAPYEPWNTYIEDLTITENSDIFINCQSDIFWKPFNNYVENSRININIRQVLMKGQNKLQR